MSTTTVGSVLDALVAALAARPLMQGVSIYSATIGPERPEECLEFAYNPVPWTEELAGLGEDERFEDYSFDGAVYIAKPGNDEDAIKVTRDRALEIVGDVETYLMANSTIGSTCRDAEMEAGELSQGLYSGTFNGRAALVTFKVHVQASKTP